MGLQEDIACEHKSGVRASKGTPLLPWLGFSCSLLQSKEEVVVLAAQPSFEDISNTQTNTHAHT